LFDVVSEIDDQQSAEFERRVRSGPKERTRSIDSVPVGQLQSADMRLVLISILLCLLFCKVSATQLTFFCQGSLNIVLKQLCA